MVFAVSLSRSTNSVAVIGGGVVGAAVAYTLARRGLAPVLLEAEDALALGASGTNSGILHTGFDSVPGALETQLILRSAAAARRRAGRARRAGAALRRGAAARHRRAGRQRPPQRRRGGAARRRARGPGRDGDRPRRLHARAGRRRAARRGRDPHRRPRGGHRARERAPAGGRRRRAATSRSTAPAWGPTPSPAWSATRASPSTRARASSSSSTRPLDRILLPVPTKRTKGVLVFPTIDGKVVAGPTAHDQSDKEDWSVRPEARAEVLDKAAAMLPALDGAEPVASYAGLRPAGADGANYVIGPSPACPAAHQRRRDPLDRALGLAGDRRARGGARSSGPGVALGADRSLPPGDVRRPRGAVVEEPALAPLILGIDEGTTGVKAALFDERLRPVREARRDKPNRHPQPGWVEQDGEEVLAGGRRRGRRAAGATRPARSWPAGWTTRASRCSPGTPRPARRSPRSSSGRTSARRRCSTASPTTRRRSRRRSGLPLRPLLLGRQARLAARARRGRAGRPRGGPAAHGHGRRVPVRPPRRRLRHRPLDRLAHAAARARPAGLRPVAVRALRRAARRAARGARHRRRPRRAAPRLVAGGAAAARADRRPAGRAGRRGLRRARPRQGDLRHRRVRPRPRRRRGARACGRPAADRGLAHRRPRSSTRIDGGVFAAGAMLEWLCRELGVARRPAGAGRAGTRAPTTAPAPACCPRWPASARRGGSRRRAPCWPACTAAPRAPTSPAPRFEGIAWRVADVVEAIREQRRRRRAARRRRRSPTSR